MKASVVHGNLTPRNKTPNPEKYSRKFLSVRSPTEGSAKCEKFEVYAANPAARSHVGAHLPAENGSLHGIAAIHAQAGRAPRSAKARRCILDIPKFARSSC